MTTREPTCVYDDDPDRIDREALWLFMSTEAYWGRWRSRDVFEAQVRASWRVVGLYEVSGAMVGFARAISDGISLAYLEDVYVLAPYRGRGLGVGLVRAMVDGGPGAHFKWMLHTNDAHGLYAKCGFMPPDSRYLERRPVRSAAGTPTIATVGS